MIVENTKAFEEKQLESFLLKDFMIAFIKLEKLLKSIFYKKFESVDENKKYRVYFYMGWINNMNYIDYDTFSTVKEAKKFDKEGVLKTITLNNIIKLNKKEGFFDKEALEIQSVNQKMTILNFESSCKKVIEMRNRIAHDFSEAKLDDKCIVEYLSRELIIKELAKYYIDFEDKLDLNSLTENSIAIFSNLFYIERLNKEVEKLL